jgi:hypothetical protein
MDDFKPKRDLLLKTISAGLRQECLSICSKPIRTGCCEWWRPQEKEYCDCRTGRQAAEQGPYTVHLRNSLYDKCQLADKSGQSAALLQHCGKEHATQRNDTNLKEQP